MKKTQFYWHMFLRQNLPNGTEKHFYFRSTEDKVSYECEEYLLDSNKVIDLKYGPVDKIYYDQVLEDKLTNGSYPSVYYGKKGDKWNAFGESVI